MGSGTLFSSKVKYRESALTFETGLKQRGLWDATMHDLFGIVSQTLQRHVLYISETYNILMKNSIIGDL